MSVKVPISNDDLKAHLAEQLGFLERSADAFDSGYEDEAKRMAVTIRVLVHDTNASTSLLKQLGKLPGQQFVDSALPQEPGTVGSYSGLLGITAGPNGGRFVAHLDDVPGSMRNIDFEDWWMQTVFKGQSGRELTRKELVMTAANQDGGAHVDPRLNESYHELAKKNSLGWFVGKSEGGFAPISGAERAAVRQIAHEVLKTLKSGYGKKSERQGLTIAGVGMRLHTAPIPPPGKKIGRNERCYCGSGKKYKHCHGRPA
jgi:hypothetical protein